MAYWKDIWKFPNSIEYEFKYAGGYGAKGEKRTKKKKATPEQIKKQNQLNREKRMRRLIKANWIPDDLWTCLKYPKGEKVTTKRLNSDLKKFTDGMRKEFKKRGEPFKFVIRKGIGENGGVHVHILCNRARGEPQTDVLIKELWTQGAVNFESIYEAGGYEKLANYIVKIPKEEEEEQLSLFPEEEQKEYIKYSTSRNLIRPEPERKVYSKWTMRKIIEDGPKATDGYFVDKNSIVHGINPYTGMSYYHYTEVRIKEYNSQNRPRGDDYYEEG